MTTDAGGRFAFDGLAPGRYRVGVFWELDTGLVLGLGLATTRQLGPWTVSYGHAHAVGGAPVNFASAHTVALRLAAGAVLTVDLAHVPPP